MLQLEHTPHAVIEHVLSYLTYARYRSVLSVLPGTKKYEFTGQLFEPRDTSTVTVGGKLDNIALHEQHDIARFVPAGQVVMTGSNYLEQTLDGFAMPTPNIKTTNRGRKKKIKPQKKRIQGSGKYFNSQITCVLQSNIDAGKIYKFKVFRNGSFQVPGCKTTDLSDIVQPLNHLLEYLSRIYDREVTLASQCVQMRNSKTRLLDYDLSINTMALGVIIEAERVSKKIPESHRPINDITKTKKLAGKDFTRRTNNLQKSHQNKLRENEDAGVDQTAAITAEFDRALVKIQQDEITHYEMQELKHQILQNRKFNRYDIGIANVEYQTAQNSSKIIVKFCRSVERNQHKTTTLKILKQKINFEGAVSNDDITEIHMWLNALIIKHYDKVIYNPVLEKQRDIEIGLAEIDAESNTRTIVVSSDSDDDSDEDGSPECTNTVDEHDRYMNNPYDD